MTTLSLVEIYFDLSQIDPMNITLPTVPNFQDDDRKFNYLYRKLRTYSFLRQRQMILFYAYRLGEFIESLTTFQRTGYKAKMSSHYFHGCVRAFHVFDQHGEDQIFRTKYLTLIHLRKLRSKDYISLCM
jgi:hypothetical protein